MNATLRIDEIDDSDFTVKALETGMAEAIEAVSEQTGAQPLSLQIMAVELLAGDLAFFAPTETVEWLRALAKIFAAEALDPEGDMSALDDLHEETNNRLQAAFARAAQAAKVAAPKAVLQ